MVDILFNSKTPEFAWLSNFSPHSVGNQPTAEHAYQASKSTNPKDWERIRSLRTPSEAKQEGKILQARFTPEQQERWKNEKVGVMRKVLRTKFGQHPELMWALVGTIPYTLYHLSPWDLYWGVDAKLQGENHLGQLLMELRDECYGLLHPRIQKFGIDKEP